MSASGQRILSMSLLRLVSVLFIGVCLSEPIIEILDIRTSSDKSLITSEVAIHNRSWLDVNFTLHEEFVGHTLFVSIHLKADINNEWKTLKRWKNIDLCRFLRGEKRDPILNFIFENALQDKTLLFCPFKVGFYSIKDAYLDANCLPVIIPKTRYRLFLEVSQMMGDAIKLFSLRIDAVYCP